jgi:outer membrane protein assembly factor BamB
MTGSNFYSVSTDLINQLWSTNLGANIQGSALTDGNLIFVSTNYNQLYALNPQSGAVVWSFNFTYSSQLVLLGPQFDGLGVSTLLFISNYYSPLQLTRLFANNGTVMWTISPPGNDSNSFATTYLPYVLGTSVYLGVYTNNSYWIWVVDIPTSQSSLRIPAYSDPLTPISPNEPLMVVNNEILYRNEGRPTKRGLISNGNGIVTTNNITFGNFPSGPFVFSDPDNVLLYATQQGIEGYQYPNWTQKVWYDFEIPWPYIPVIFLLH